jgi:branched-chain amino acid transport system substrate-binding protein
VVACSSDGAAPVASDAAEITTTTVAPARSDGQLVVGVLLPSSGTAGSLVGDGMIAAVRDTRAEINRAGGVLGLPLQLVEADEGETASSAHAALGALCDAFFNAIVGPGSSVAALAVLDTARSAGLVSCSPTASALELDAFPDEGLFFRTIPSDTLAMAALAQVAEQTGEASVAIAYLDDRYGRGLRDAAIRALAGRPLAVGDVVGFRSDDTSLRDEAAELLRGEPAVVVVLADAVGGAQLVAALAEASSAGGNRPVVIANDTLRDPVVQTVIAALPESFRSRLTGVGPLAAPEPADDDAAVLAPFAAMASDCVTLIALAAEQGDSDQSSSIASELPLVSVGGSICRTFDACLERIAEGLQIDYTGASGNTDLSASTGDPTNGRFERFAFDDDGSPTSIASFTVTR